MRDMIHSGHRERLRQRFMTFGADSLCEHELIELVLFYALPRINTNELAHTLIKEFGTINNILNAPIEELMSVTGIGRSAAEFIRLLGDMCGEYDREMQVYEKLLTTEEVSDYFVRYFKDAASGLYLILCLGDELEVISRISFNGAKKSFSKCEFRHLVSDIMRNGCERVVLGIKHSGTINLKEDSISAAMLSEKLKPFNIELMQCIAVSSDEWKQVEFKSLLDIHSS
ncbi:MAG: hypothetical protein K5979_09535 [Ruminococcus sp.]|nr:hypothetical protein [Ruminococcus sp.]